MGLHKKVGTHQDYIWLSLSGLPVRDRTQTDLTGQSSFFFIWHLDSPIKSWNDTLREMFTQDADLHIAEASQWWP